ncbi:hypothetical protein, partial [Enterobacter hormaechei]
MFIIHTTISNRNNNLSRANGLNAVRCFNGCSGLIAATFTAAFDDCRRHIASIKKPPSGGLQYVV